MNKLKILMLALISLSLIFTSCENNEPKLVDVNAKVVDGNNYNTKIDVVYAYAYDADYDDLLVGEAKYEKGGFNMKLNAVLSGNLSENDFSDKIKVTDKTVKTTSVEMFVAKKDDDKVGVFICTNANLSKLADSNFDIDNISAILYIYADKDVKITGTQEEYKSIFEFDLSLKMGWNTVVANVSETKVTFSTVRRIPKDYKWHYLSMEAFYSINPAIKYFSK